MKLVIALFSVIVAVFNIYDISFNGIDGTGHSVNEYRGKKIWIVILPGTQTASDSGFLRRIDSVALSHPDIQTIFIPSIEDGFSDSTALDLRSFYQALLDSSLIITEPMYTHLASDTLQHPLFRWLTHVNENTHFEQEVGGAGEMYFINEQGELYGVFGPEAKNSDKLLNKMF